VSVVVKHAMTVDVEDYFHVSAFENKITSKDWASLPLRVEKNTYRLLELFEEHSAKCTFFTLGWVAEHCPNLIKAIVDQGWRAFTADQDNTNSWGGVQQQNQQNRPSGDDIYAVPQALKYVFEEQQRERFNGQMVLQWAPNESMTATVDYNYYENRIATQANDLSAWFTFAPSENVWTDGPVSAPVIYEETYGTPQDFSMGASDFANRFEGDAVGFNFEWQVSDALHLEFDAHHSAAERTPDSKYGSSNVLSTAAFIRTSAGGDFTTDRPTLVVGGGNDVTPEDMVVTGSVFGNSQDFSEVDQLQFKGKFDLNDDSSLDFGVGYSEISNHSQSVNIQRNDWGGVGAPGDLDSSLFPARDVSDQFDHAGGDFDEVGGRDVQDIYFHWDFAGIRDLAEALYSGGVDPLAAGDCGTMFCPSSDFGRDTDRKTVETTTSAYLQYHLANEDASMPWNFHAGLRYETTDVDSDALSANYSGTEWVAATEIILVRDAANPLTTLSQSGSYDVLLPNLNFNINLTDDVVARAAFSETISRPGYNDLKGGTVVGTIANRGGASGGSGNPALKPLKSRNLDLSFEWYYADSSYASIGLFNKKLTDFVGNATVESDIFNLSNPADGAKYQAAVAATGTNDADTIRNWIFQNYANDPSVDVANGIISGDPATDNTLMFELGIPVNSDTEETIKGMEFAVQHVFGESGFGVQANYTMVETDNEFDNTSLEGQHDLIRGISDTANLVGFYENDYLSARLAWNWRDDFLNATGENTGPNPVYTEAYQQVDMMITYNVEMLDGLQLMLEGYNITDENNRTYNRHTNMTMEYAERGARWVVGARYSF